jgi:hypothetical protein
MERGNGKSEHRKRGEKTTWYFEIVHCLSQMKGNVRWMRYFRMPEFIVKHRKKSDTTQIFQPHVNDQKDGSDFSQIFV